MSSSTSRWHLSSVPDPTASVSTSACSVWRSQHWRGNRATKVTKVDQAAERELRRRQRAVARRKRGSKTRRKRKAALQPWSCILGRSVSGHERALDR
jgi:hypothetical protein